MSNNKNISNLLDKLEIDKNVKLDMRKALKSFDFKTLVEASIEYKNYFNSKEYLDLQNKIDREFDILFKECEAFEMVLIEINKDSKNFNREFLDKKAQEDFENDLLENDEIEEELEIDDDIFYDLQNNLLGIKSNLEHYNNLNLERKIK